MNNVGTVGNYNFEKNASFNGVTVEKAATQTISIKQSPAFAQGLNNLDKKGIMNSIQNVIGHLSIYTRLDFH